MGASEEIGMWALHDVWSNSHAPGPMGSVAAGQRSFALGPIRGPS